MARATKATATAAGKLKGAGKALQGYPGIFHHLAGEHGEVAALMQRITRSDGPTRDEVFPELKLNLLAHAHAEEQEFYPRLSSFAELEALVDRCKSDHKEVENLLQRLSAEDKHTDSWLALFEQMKAAVEEHVEREEKELFPQARDLLTRDQAGEMEKHYEDAEEREKAALA